MALSPQEAVEAFRLLKDRDDAGLQNFINRLARADRLDEFQHWYTSMRYYIDRAIIKAVEEEEQEQARLLEEHKKRAREAGQS